MIPVIAQKNFGHYVAGMASAVVRLLALVALVMMPLGMSGAPAFAAPSDNYEMTMAGHCGEEQEKAPAPKKMDCAAACTAIPATAPTEVAVPLKLSGPGTIALVAAFTGIVLELATPPPRQG